MVLKIYRYLRWEVVKLRSFLIGLPDRIWKPTRSIELDSIIAKVSKKDFFFVQIGANDGSTGDDLNDFIRKNNWKGIMVEPVPYVFKRLQANYSGYSNICFENSAIAEKTGVRSFYTISEFDLEGKNLYDCYSPYKLDQLGSFDLKTLMKHSYMHEDFKNLIVETPVNTISYDDLMVKYANPKVTLLQIDAEGYDYEILRTIDVEYYAPSIIIFEHQHLSRENYRKIVIRLRKNGYKLYVNGWDTYSIK